MNNMQIPKSYENEERIGFTGRGTAQNQDIKGLIGDVYDTHGHLLYDKDYFSNGDDEKSEEEKPKEPSFQKDATPTKISASMTQSSHMINLDIVEKSKQSMKKSSIEKQQSFKNTDVKNSE